MHASIILGSIVCLAILFLIVKVLYNLISNSNILKYEIPEGWKSKLSSRFPIYNNLDEINQIKVCKKTQILVAQRSIKGLEGLRVTIDLRLALSFQISLLNQLKSSANQYSKISPISILPFSRYNEFKNSGSFTLYWDQEKTKLFLETPDNNLIEDSYYLWLKVDKRFSSCSDSDLLEIHRDLSNGIWPVSNPYAQGVLGHKKI